MPDPEAACPDSFGFHSWRSGELIARHRHGRGLLCVVLAGAIEEAGDVGRRLAGPGDILIHPPFLTHQLRILRRDAIILHLPLPEGIDSSLGEARLEDAGLLFGALSDGFDAAASTLATAMQPRRSCPRHWIDRLARSAAEGRRFSLKDWCEREGIAAATACRKFKAIFGTSPAAFGRDARSRRAYGMIMSGRDALAEIACACGFSDQSHMTRALVRYAGDAPGRLRRRHSRSSQEPLFRGFAPDSWTECVDHAPYSAVPPPAA